MLHVRLDNINGINAVNLLRTEIESEGKEEYAFFAKIIENKLKILMSTIILLVLNILDSVMSGLNIGYEFHIR